MLPDASAWTQLQSLILKDSLAWLEDEVPFQFHALTRLTKLELPGCLFGLCMPRVLGNTHQHKINRFQAPTSIVNLDINTKAIRVGHSSVVSYILHRLSLSLCLYVLLVAYGTDTGGV